ncbi:MAG TPA: VOC family protein [Noviherbaspirillum sp.]|nr:VOC family protein [Noviherbaspirillum sp.]
MSAIIGGATVYAKDLKCVVAFYEEVCGLRLTLREHDFVVLENGQLQIVIVEIPEHIARTFEISSPPVRREDSALKLTFVVENVAAARVTACKLGGVIDPKEKEWEFQGMLVCDGHDPEGNVIQVREHAL